jgi:hypothetical protein
MSTAAVKRLRLSRRRDVVNARATGVRCLVTSLGVDPAVRLQSPRARWAQPAWSRRLLEPWSALVAQAFGAPCPMRSVGEEGAGKVRASTPALWALAYRHNQAVETDAQVRPLPSVAPVLGRRSLLRYPSAMASS